MRLSCIWSCPAAHRRTLLPKTDVWVKNTPDTVVYERYVKDMNGNIKGDKIDAKVRALQKQEKSEKNKAKAAALAKQIKVLQAESNEVDILTSFHLDHGNGLDVSRGRYPGIGCTKPHGRQEPGIALLL